MTERSTKIILGSLGLATAAGIHYGITRVLVDVAVCSEKPKYLEKVTGLVNGANLEQSLSDTVNAKAEEVRQTFLTRNVEITSYDGLKLAGHYYENPNAERIIIAVHGWRSWWCRDFSFISDFWVENNCSVLFIDQRGHGDSEGKYIGLGLTERYDIRDWAKYIDENTKDIPIYLAGISMGATSVLMASNLELPERVKGIMADCGFTGPLPLMKKIVEKNLHISFELRRPLAERMIKKRLGLDDLSFSTVDALRETNIPVLFIHGGEDGFIPVEMTFENYIACASAKELLIVPGANHGISYHVETKKYQRSVLDFIEKCEKQ